MPVNLSVKNGPDALAARLRERAQGNHRSLQGELMAIIGHAVEIAPLRHADSAGAQYDLSDPHEPANLLDRLTAIAGARGIDTSRKLTREAAHDRKKLRKSRA